MYGKCLARSKHSGNVCFRYCHTRISAVCSLKEYRELRPWCSPIRKSCYCLVNSVDEDTEKVGYHECGWEDQPKIPGCQRTSCPADQGSQQVRTTCSRPCTDCECEYSVAAASPLPSRACADCLLWPKQHTQRSNLAKLTRVHYSPPVGLAPIYTHSLCVCVCVCVCTVWHTGC